MNANIISSTVGGITAQITADTFPEVDINDQRPFFVTRWQLMDIFQLYDSVAIKVSNIEKPDKVGFELIPFDDILKRILLNDSSNDYYFILYKIDIESIEEVELFALNVAKSDNNFYIYLSFIEPLLKDGGGEGDPTSGVRIPNPPQTNPPS